MPRPDDRGVHDAEGAGPVRKRDAERAGPVRKRDAEGAGPVRKRDAEGAGPVRKRDAERAGPVGKRDADVVAGRRPVLEVLRAGRGAERVLVARELAPSRVVGEVRRRAEAAGVPVRVVARSDIDQLCPGLNHQGVVALTGPFCYTPLEDVLTTEGAAVAFLDGVMDPHNLGSILRSADAAGFAGVVIAARRAAGVTSAVRRVSAGASEVVPVARVTNLGRALDGARRAGMWTVGLDQDAEEDLWTSHFMDPPVALVLGSEDRGISPGVRRHCDAFVSIPQRGGLASLNVAAAGAVAMFEVARRRAPSWAGEQGGRIELG